MTDEIIKQVDANAMKSLKAAAGENDPTKHAVRTGTALKLVDVSAKLEKQRFDQDLETKKLNLEEEKVRLQNDLEKQKRIDMIHQREAQERADEQNRIDQERQLAMRLAADCFGVVTRVAGGFALVKYGVTLEKHDVIASKFIDFAIKQFPNPFRKG